MLSTRVFLKNQILLPLQWFNTSLRLSSKSSLSSSSSDSSDSDSDTDSIKRKVQEEKKTIDNKKIKTHNENNELSQMIQALLNTKHTKKVSVSVQMKHNKNKLEQKLKEAAETLTSTFGGNQEQVISTLLESIYKIQEKHIYKNDQETNANVNTGILKNDARKFEYTKESNKSEAKYLEKGARKFEYTKESNKSEAKYLEKGARKFENRRKSQEMDTKYSKTEAKNFQNRNELNRFGHKYKGTQSMIAGSVIKQSEITKNRYQLRNAEPDRKTINKTQDLQMPNNSIITTLLNEQKASKLKERFSDSSGKFPSIFQNIQKPSPNVCTFKVWDQLEEHELELQRSMYPKNGFQEMIQWTKEGKLWKFPIDNEQGMEEEQNVHFSEHVFLERHLTDWCPTKGPIRHFMELVCTGLSKNPYLTVQEKQDHIMWYKNYFDDKKDLLKKLGAIDTDPSNIGKQIESH